MKKFSTLMLLIAAFALVSPACKKGEEDPGLSLKSRASRLAGEWNVSSYESTETDEQSTQTTTTTFTHEGSDLFVDMVTDYNSADPNDEFSDTLTVDEHTFTFDKEGTYTKVYAWTWDNSGSGVTDIYKERITEEGTWQFLGKSGDYKNKERIALTPTKEVEEITTTRSTDDPETQTETTTNTYSSQVNAQVYNLVRLAGDEIILTTDHSAVTVDETSTSTTSDTYTETKTEKITLTAGE